MGLNIILHLTNIWIEFPSMWLLILDKKHDTVYCTNNLNKQEPALIRKKIVSVGVIFLWILIMCWMKVGAY